MTVFAPGSTAAVTTIEFEPGAVMDGDAFYGLITRADVLNQLRKQVQQGMPRQS